MHRSRVCSQIERAQNATLWIGLRRTSSWRWYVCKDPVSQTRRSALFQTSVKDGFTRGPYRSSNNYRTQNVSYPIWKATNRGFPQRNRTRRTWISHHLSPNFVPPANAVFLFENRNFLMHRPHQILNFWPCATHFPSIKWRFSSTSPPSNIWNISILWSTLFLMLNLW